MGTIGSIKVVFGLATIAVTAITSWILGVRMRRRIKRTLGITPTNEMELTSLKTWMNVENIEEKNRGGKLR
ncbi:MAG TPA: hypothetical protein VK812_19190 [Candidatus Binatus sp.]|jgi:hypothetical protein|nr:hypothetical protein [Candidatus Binatus sp.]